MTDLTLNELLESDRLSQEASKGSCLESRLLIAKSDALLARLDLARKQHFQQIERSRELIEFAERWFALVRRSIVW
jgi:hypothetical protein